MSYYFSTIVHVNFANAIQKVTDALKTEGFCVLTEIDMRATMKKKLDVDIPPYTILGACNPPFAYLALQAEEKIGTMLPCNVVVQEIAPGKVEVAAVDPVASMQAIQNPLLGELAEEVSNKLKKVIQQLK
jgi:uncharacterized protein (DUF302 family)